MAFAAAAAHASHATHYISNCFRDPQAFVVASTIVRANRVSQIMPKYDAYEKAITKSFYGTLGGAVTLGLSGPEILYRESHVSHNLTSRVWNRITSLVGTVTTSLLDWVTRHSQVVIYIAGLAFIVSAGVIVYSAWIAPTLANKLVPVDEQDVSAIQAMGLKPRERLLQQKSDLASTISDTFPVMPVLPVCQICREAPPSFACTECGNLVLCADHLEKYLSTFGNKCPVCRDTPQKFLKIKVPKSNVPAEAPSPDLKADPQPN